MENLETMFKLVAIEFPINSANIAVPIPTEPPKSAPIIKIVTSIDSRTRAILMPVLLWIEVIKPSRGPGPKLLGM